MDQIQLLSTALGIAALAGINLYLTVLLTGLAVRYDWIHLSSQYQDLQILGHPAILILAGTLYALEFFADKIPWVDSLWDTMHTVIRPVGGTLLAIQVLGDSNPVFSVIVAILAGGVSMATHSVKAGTRLMVNSSPEPFSNIAISTAEDAGVIGGLWLLHAYPVIFLALMVLFLASALYFAPRLWRGISLKLWLMWRKLNGPASGRQTSHLPSWLPADHSMLLAGLNPGNKAVEWAVPCACGRVPGIPTGLFGYLVALVGEEPKVHFVANRRFRSVAQTFDLDGWRISHEPGFLSENLVFYRVSPKQKRIFLIDRPRSEIARQIFARIEERLGETPSPASESASIPTPAVI